MSVSATSASGQRRPYPINRPVPVCRYLLGAMALGNDRLALFEVAGQLGVIPKIDETAVFSERVYDRLASPGDSARLNVKGLNYGIFLSGSTSSDSRSPMNVLSEPVATPILPYSPLVPVWGTGLLSAGSATSGPPFPRAKAQSHSPLRGSRVPLSPGTDSST